MMSGSWKNRPSGPFTLLLLLAAAALAAGCSDANTSGGGGTSVNHVLPSGSSVAGWTIPTGGSQHAIAATNEYASKGTLDSCTECHGSALEGGISNTSCFGATTVCHHGTIAGWFVPSAVPPPVEQHGVWAKRAIGDGSFFSCQICHGRDFSGGGSQVPCFDCHAPPHAPAPWRGAGYTHTNTNQTNAPVCAQCHFSGSQNNPPNHPPTPAPAGTPPGCFNSTLCHDAAGSGGAPHPVPYNDPSHYTETAATFPANCGACHDVTAPTVKPGPACQTCHVAASPLTAANCTSCHASPPNDGAPAGAVYPNIAGAHSTHIALDNTGSPISCDTCHNGLGPSLLNLNHYNRANNVPGENALRVPPGDAAFLATYYAATGASTFNNAMAALSCSNVSCHGGQATPNWQTGTLDVNTQCTSCHQFGPSVGNPQYNSPYSGEHGINGSHSTCTNCHNTTALAVNHFTTLADNTMSPADASLTIGSSFITTWTPGAGTSGTCNALCHPGDRTW